MKNLFLVFFLLVSNAFVFRVCHASSYSDTENSDRHLNALIGEQPLAKIAIQKTVVALHESASIRATPLLLGLKVNNVVHCANKCVIDINSRY